MSMITDDLTEWFYKLPLNEVVSHDVIAKKIRDLRIEHETNDRRKAITQADVARAVTACRKELELRKKTTLVNVAKKGYKLATPKELAITTAKWAKRTVMYADRTYRLVDIADRRLIPGAIAKVFGSAEGQIKSLSGKSRQFAQAFVAYAEQHKTKRIEDKGDSNGKNNGVKRKKNNK